MQRAYAIPKEASDRKKVLENFFVCALPFLKIRPGTRFVSAVEPNIMNGWVQNGP